MKRPRTWFPTVRHEHNDPFEEADFNKTRRIKHVNLSGTTRNVVKIFFLVLQFGSIQYVISQSDDNTTLIATSFPTAGGEVNQTQTPSLRETSSEQPSVISVLTRMPSFAITVSPQPTSSTSPTLAPTVTSSPTAVISERPSSYPTFTYESSSRSRFRQTFEVPDDERFFNPATLFVSVVESYTNRFAPVSYNALNEIVTTCIVNLQGGIESNKTNTFLNEVEYSCSYISTRTDVTNFTDYFMEYVNSNLTGFTKDLQGEGLSVFESLEVVRRVIKSPAPSISNQPSSSPSKSPSTTFPPSPGSTFEPTISILLVFPTLSPTLKEITWSPSPAPTGKEKVRKLSIVVVAAIVIFSGGGVLSLLLWYYLSWRRKQILSAMEPHVDSVIHTERTNNTGRPWASTGAEIDDRNIALSPTESVLSNKSFLSTGDSPLGDASGDEFDGTNDLLDEFDKYKDQNLEQFRDDVENKVAGMESIISAAVTMAHMPDSSTNLDETELRWNCDKNCSGIDIEATALYEVCDWVKRNEAAPPERRRAFMEDLLNKMVASVKNGILNADDGSRTIHEAAAILGLNMAEALPMTTLIISGMRKTARVEDLTRALREFGDVDVAAVASGFRGFGIVRFRRPKSVERAMRRYNTGEIVIQDVAVQMKILKANGVIDSRAPPEHFLNN